MVTVGSIHSDSRSSSISTDLSYATLSPVASMHSIEREMSPGADISSSENDVARLESENTYSTATPKYAAHQTASIASSGDDNPPDRAPSRPALWRSIWLQRRTLCAFLLIFTSLWIALILTWRYDVRNNGIRITVSSNHYTWKYGPTAVLVIVVSLWRQTDYHCKVIQPWIDMKKGASRADKSVLVDYISPLQITSFFVAARNHHFFVAASVLGFAILKLVILVSTALLESAPTLTSIPVPVSVTTAFGLPKSLKNDPNWQPQGLYLPYENITSKPIYSYLGVVRGTLTDPVGVQDGVAFQSFNIPYTGYNTTAVSLSLDTFVPNITCEAAESTGLFHADSGVLEVNMTVGRYCSDILDSRPLPRSTRLVRSFASVCNYGGYGCKPTEIVNSFDLFGCSPESDLEAAKDWKNYYRRFALISAKLSFQSRNETTDRYRSHTLHGVESVLCRVDYNIVKAAITQNVPSGTIEIAPENQHKRQHPDLTGAQLDNLISSSLYTLSAETSFGEEVDPREMWQDASLVVFSMMGSLNGTSRETFFDTASLGALGTKLFSGLSTHMVREYFLQPTRLNATGTGLYQENRIRVQVVSLWIMVGGLLTLSLLTLILLNATQGAVSQNPASLSTYSTILAKSPSLHVALRGTGELRSSALNSKLRGFSFWTVSNDHFCVETEHTDQDSESSTEDGKPKNGKKRPWIPFTSKIPILALTFCLPIGAICALEALYQVSIKQQGFLVPPVYWTRYASTLVFLLIATLFNSLDFTVVTFAPFSALRSGYQPASRGMLTRLQGEMPLVALYHAARHKLAGAALSNVACLIGSVLTVVISGLWVTEATILRTDVTMSPSHTWDPTWSNSTRDDGGAARRFAEVQRNIRAVSKDIWQDLVFPRLGEPSFVDNSVDSKPFTSFTVTVSALRPELVCDIIPPERLTIITEGPGPLNSSSFWKVKLNIRRECLGTRVFNDSSDGSNGFKYRWDIAKFDANGWLGYLQDLDNVLLVRNKTRLQRQKVKENKQPRFSVCPSVVVFFGTWKKPEVSAAKFTSLLCFQKVQEVQTRVRYVKSSDGDTAMSSESPITDELSARNLTNENDGSDSFNYHLQRHLMDFGLFIDRTGKPTHHDEFFDSLIHGPNGVEPEDMTPRLLVEKVTQLYKKYMVNVIDMNFRLPRNTSTASGISSSSVPESIPAIRGTALTTVPRLTIDYASKLALQIILAVMVVLGVLAYWLADLRGTLPRDPSSIASRMALFAGSDLATEDLMPKGAEWMSSRELERVWARRRFGLGWWDPNGASGEGEERFGVDVGIPNSLGFRRGKGKEGVNEGA